MSIDNSREMSEPYAALWLSFHAAAAVLFGLAAALAASTRRFLRGLGAWFVTGLAIEFASTAVWQHTCPP